jgi:hypothetical protein
MTDCHKSFTFVIENVTGCSISPSPDPGIEISAFSQGMSKGLRQTDGVQILVRPEVTVGLARSSAPISRTSPLRPPTAKRPC